MSVGSIESFEEVMSLYTVAARKRRINEQQVHGQHSVQLNIEETVRFHGVKTAVSG